MTPAGPGTHPERAHDGEARNLQVQVARELVELSLQRSYMNTERTLAVWTRTALSLMIFGIAVDRFGLLMNHPPWHVVDTRQLLPNPLSTLGGVVLVAIGVLIVVTAAIRHQRYRTLWNRTFGRDETFGPWLAFPFAAGVALLGIATLVLLLVLVQ